MWVPVIHGTKPITSLIRMSKKKIIIIINRKEIKNHKHIIHNNNNKNYNRYSKVIIQILDVLTQIILM